LAQYGQLLALHIVPFIGSKLVTEVNDINVLRQFEGDLFMSGRSPAMIRKVLTGLSGILGKAKELKFITRRSFALGGCPVPKGGPGHASPVVRPPAARHHDDNQAYGLQPTSPKHRHKKRRLELGAAQKKRQAPSSQT
jgi:hypothetical protein